MSSTPITLVFEKFAQCGNVRQVLPGCRQEGIRLPAVLYGPRGPQVIWRLPVYNTIHKLLTNPTYAGAYVFGKTDDGTARGARR